MPIIFENIDNGQTIGIDRQLEGKHYRAKLAAVINSSNLSPNSDRGQDYGWRLQPEQQAQIEQWEQDGHMIDVVSQKMNVQVDALTHADFLAYLLYQQELTASPEQGEIAQRRSNEQAYNARVETLRKAEHLEPVAPFKPLSLEEFMGDEAPAKAEPATEPPVIKKTVLTTKAKK